MRTGGVPVRGAAKAGTMASRNGRATAVPMPVPTPRRKARRGSDFRVIMAVVPLFAIETADCAQSGRSTTGTRTRWRPVCGRYRPPYAGHRSPALCLAVSYTHLRAHETVLDLVCRLLLEKK